MAAVEEPEDAAALHTAKAVLIEKGKAGVTAKAAPNTCYAAFSALSAKHHKFYDVRCHGIGCDHAEHMNRANI